MSGPLCQIPPLLRWILLCSLQSVALNLPKTSHSSAPIAAVHFIMLVICTLMKSRNIVMYCFKAVL